MENLVGKLIKCEDGIKRIVTEQYIDTFGSVLTGENFEDYINRVVVIDNKSISEILKENEQLKKEITELKGYIEDKDNRINHPLKCNFKFREDNNE